MDGNTGWLCRRCQGEFPHRPSIPPKYASYGFAGFLIHQGPISLGPVILMISPQFCLIIICFLWLYRFVRHRRKILVQLMDGRWQIWIWLFPPNSDDFPSIPMIPLNPDNFLSVLNISPQFRWFPLNSDKFPSILTISSQFWWFPLNFVDKYEYDDFPSVPPLPLVSPPC